MRKPMSRERMLERYKEGFGSGDDINYKPWLGVGSFPNLGNTHRQVGRLIRRHHVLLSDHEQWAFLAAQWLDGVVDIREQYPLWPLEETEAIAESLGFIHPGTDAAHPQVMTTDLLLTLRDGSYEAISVKPSSVLEELGKLKNLEIERRYWLARKVPWSIVTERDVPPDLAHNLAYLDACHDLRADVAGEHGIDAVEERLFAVLDGQTDARLDEACLAVDGEFGIGGGVALTIARRALARKHWSVPLDVRIDPAKPLCGLQPGPIRSPDVAAVLPRGKVRRGRSRTGGSKGAGRGV